MNIGNLRVFFFFSAMVFLRYLGPVIDFWVIIHISFFIPLSINGVLVCLYVGIVNSIAMNMGVYVSFSVQIYFFSKI